MAAILNVLTSCLFRHDGIMKRRINRKNPSIKLRTYRSIGSQDANPNKKEAETIGGRRKEMSLEDFQITHVSGERCCEGLELTGWGTPARRSALAPLRRATVRHCSANAASRLLWNNRRINHVIDVLFLVVAFSVGFYGFKIEEQEWNVTMNWEWLINRVYGRRFRCEIDSDRK